MNQMLHFQNTGNYPATFVTLKIPVDANLDISTFQFIGASHTVSKISADNNRILTIHFNYINLPDSSVDRLGSQGFAAFTFKQKKGLAPLSTIHESANIYFDYNSPVPTNQTLNTISSNTGIAQEINQAEIKVYPNPTLGNVMVDMADLNEDKAYVTVYDITGREVLSLHEIDISNNKKVQLNTTALSAGVYVIEVNAKNKYVQKLIKNQ